VLKIEGVTQRYGEFCALRDVTFSVEDGEILGLIGPNGAGKTTLLNGITGLNPVTEGQVELDGKRIERLRRDQIARLGVSRTFQNLRLFRGMTVLEHLTVAQNCGLRVREQLFGTKKQECQLRDEAYAILEGLGISAFAQSLAEELSYGDCRRVEIARALANRPKLLLLDEPGAGMNEEESAAMAEQILKIRSDFSVSILLIEHDMTIIRRCCQRVVVLNYGEKIAQGSFAEIAADEEVRKAYLGEDDDAIGSK
jgi:branched-chain amino acid transport system ATP-binding protein